MLVDGGVEAADDPRDEEATERISKTPVTELDGLANEPCPAS